MMGHKTLTFDKTYFYHRSGYSTPPWSYLDMFWTLAFSLIVVTALLGNCLVLWIVAGKGPHHSLCVE